MYWVVSTVFMLINCKYGQGFISLQQFSYSNIRVTLREPKVNNLRRFLKILTYIKKKKINISS